MLALLTIFNLIGFLAMFSKRKKLIALAEGASDPEEKAAFLRSAGGQVWKILLFGIGLGLCIIGWLMILSAPN